MKKIGLALLLCVSAATNAAQQCRVDIKNEVHLDGSQVKIYHKEDSKVLIDENNNVYIDGKKLSLNQMQQDAVASYREHMNQYLPKALDIANDALALVQSAIDDIATSFNNSEAFNNLKQALDSFFKGLEQRYKKENQFVLQEAAFGDAFNNWQDDLAAAKETFNSEFFSSAFTVLSEQMSAEGGLILLSLKRNFSTYTKVWMGKLKRNLK